MVTLARGTIGQRRIVLSPRMSPLDKSCGSCEGSRSAIKVNLTGIQATWLENS